MSRCRVLQLGTSGPLYGAERWILALCRNLDPQRVNSQIAVINDKKDSEEAPLTLAARALELDVCEIAAPGRINFVAVHKLRSLIKQHKIQIVHSHGYKADAIALLAVRGTGAKFLATPHGWCHGAGPKLRLYEWLDRHIFRLADAVAPLSPDLTREMEQIESLAGKLTLIPNGVDLLEIDTESGINSIVSGLHKQGPVVGYVGQLIARKNLSHLLRAFAAWGRKDAWLVLVGEGDARASLEAEAHDLGIANQTLLAGWQCDRLDWMRGFDLFVLPSLSEGMPRCLMEAMAAGIPVAASDIAGNRDLVRAHRTGQLFPVGDVAALTRCLDQLGTGRLDAMVTRARRAMEVDHSGAAMARRYENLFDELVA